MPLHYVKQIPLSPSLREFVEFLWYVVDAPRHARERILPGGTTELVINLHADEIRIADPEKGEQRFTGAVVSGPYDRAFDIDSAQHARIMGVHFRPGGAFPFVGVPLRELFSTHVDLRDLWGTRANVLRERACAAASPTDCFAVVEQTLLSFLDRPPKRHAAVQTSLDALDQGRASLGVSEVIERVGLSHRRFIELFTAEVGMTPKLFSRVRRFRRTLDRVRPTVTPDWARLSALCGYCDQSHLIREFLAFSRVSPANFFARRHADVKDDHMALD